MTTYRLTVELSSDQDPAQLHADAVDALAGVAHVAVDGGLVPVMLPPCDVVEGCPNPSVDCIGGEVYYCADHEALSGESYWEWRRSPERARRVTEAEEAS